MARFEQFPLSRSIGRHGSRGDSRVAIPAVNAGVVMRDIEIAGDRVLVAKVVRRVVSNGKHCTAHERKHRQEEHQPPKVVVSHDFADSPLVGLRQAA
jgi:hypothetical protein